VRKIIVIAFILSAAVTLQAMQQPQLSPAESGISQEFEVATIKPHPPGRLSNVRAISFDTPGRFIAVNITAKALVGAAFDLPDDRVSGGPHWDESQGFDVVGKISEADWETIDKLDNYLRTQSMRCMLRSLLQERFHLAVAHESKRLQVYALTVTRGGAKLQAGKSSAPSEIPKPYLMGFSQKDSSIGTLADFLSHYFQCTVVDHTGLSGHYDINLTVALPANNTPEERDSALFRALEDQLGLKLESRKELVDTIIITRMEEPSTN
jgi:bla regulator protein blaR1